MTIRFGTNINHKKNYEQAKCLLINIFGNVVFSEPEYSRDYNAAPSDSKASTYLNFECIIETEKDKVEVIRLLKDAEQSMGRTSERKARGIIDADFDIIA